MCPSPDGVCGSLCFAAARSLPRALRWGLVGAFSFCSRPACVWKSSSVAWGPCEPAAVQVRVRKLACRRVVMWGPVGAQTIAQACEYSG